MPNCYYYDEQRNRCNCYVNENLNELLAENAKLKQEIERWHRLTAGIELPEYPITEFKPKDIERENAKLRELLRDMLMSPQEYCEKYGIEYEGWSSADDHIDDRMQELGIEVV